MSKPLRVKTQRALATVLHVAPSTVSKWVDDGLRPEQDGTWDVERARQHRDQAADRTKAGTSRSETATYWHDRERKAKTIKAEMELAERSGKLVSREEVNRVWEIRVFEVRDGLKFLGRELAPQLVNRTNPRDIQTLIDKRVEAILSNLAAAPPAAKAS